MSGSVATASYGPGRLEPRGGGGDRGREPLGVGRGAQPGDEHVAVAVVGRAGELARDEPPAAARRGRAALRAGVRRGAAGRGGAFALRSASSSLEQIGHLAVSRLWRQKSPVIGARPTLAADDAPPRDGARVTPRRRIRSPAGRSGTSSKRRTTARSTSRSSSVAKAAPRQRRTPPPNGSQV